MPRDVGLGKAIGTWWSSRACTTSTGVEGIGSGTLRPAAWLSSVPSAPADRGERASAAGWPSGQH